MDLLYIAKERYIFISIFTIMILLSLLMLFATWKNHFYLSKRLLALVTVISMIIIVLSIIALIFILSFGYNT
ncbi:MAG TPA: hypothetical protein VK108_05305 [Pseudogracilibacillus sp.]|nr:hypothetical protein [Pseudogracilibacillus sp.]